MPRNAPKSLLRSQVFRATTTNPHTKDFTHLLPYPRHWAKRTSHKDPHLNTVKPHDRIKYWNIVPGDKIGLLGDSANTVHEVLSVNKLSNRVFLKNSASGEQKPDEQPAKSKSVDYARCRLFLGEHEYPSATNPADFIRRPVFAKRLGTSKPAWRDGHWQWDRFAVHTAPALPAESGSEKRIQVPWPDYTEPAKPPPTAYDTAAETVQEVTYRPPPLRTGSSVRSWPIAPAPEKEYIRRLWNDIPHDNTLLAELYLQPELARVDSRARRQERWQAQRTADRALLDEIIAAERKHGRHKSKAAAAGAAVVKWKAKLHEDKKLEKLRRAIQRGDIAKRERKVARKEKKETRRLERLRTLVLEEAPNQVLPTVTA